MCNVLVTGGSRGIGLAISEKLAGADFVIAVARRESGELRAAIGEATQGNLHFRACDLSAVDGLPAFVKSMRDEFGAIYGLVNNAGIGTEGLLATMHNSDIEALVRLNVLSPVILTKYIVRHRLRSRHRGLHAAPRHPPVDLSQTPRPPFGRGLPAPEITAERGNVV
jgi:3-oxoacyl-[acyl-carrier protein] reductase